MNTRRGEYYPPANKITPYLVGANCVRMRKPAGPPTNNTETHRAGGYHPLAKITEKWRKKYALL